MATSSTTCLHIFGISVDCSTSRKNIESAEVQLRGVKTPIERDAGGVKMLEMKFDTPMELSREDIFSLRLLHKTRFGRGEVEIKFDTKEIVCGCSANRKHVYRKRHGNIVIDLTVSLVGNTSTEHAVQSASSSEESLGLYPTTDDIFKFCPRFRILVIGMVGVGKSSLIKRAFGMQQLLASNDKPGEVNVDTEFISPQNNRFVLHDSNGFQPGDKNSVEIVREFIQRRKDMVFKDKLHAVWICFEIPRLGGRLLAAGTKDFLRLKRDGELGNVPVVVVLTKYDMLLGRMERTLNESALVGLSDDDVKEYIKEKVDAELQRTCIKPLERFAGSAIPWAVVSNKEEHKSVIAHLIQITEYRVRQYVTTEALVMTGVAQRVDPVLDIKTSIEVGKRKYSSAEGLPLHSTTDDPLKICPQFRILMIGKVGVGKSSLINHLFGVQEALASNIKRGEANIETEFISPQNDRLVLHNSNGFGPGDGNNLETVREFIQQRRVMPALKDKLHAVWFFFQIPHSDGRLLEASAKDFLRLKRDGELGNIPVVVVLTKYDILINRVDRELDESVTVKLSDKEIERYIKEIADAELQETCIKPLEKFAGSAIPCAVVSKKEEHKDRIFHLIQITKDLVRQHVAIEASVTASFALSVDPMYNVKTSIEIGKRRYWKALKEQTLQACQDVLHTDIVRVWNFRDPHHYLESKEFKQLVMTLVDTLNIGLIQLPRMVLRHFIAYLVDLTSILHMLYVVSDNEDVTRRMIKLAVAVYCDSSTIAEVHYRINKYDGYLPLRYRQDQETLAVIEELMNEFSIKASEIPGLRANIPAINSQPDEPW